MKFRIIILLFILTSCVNKNNSIVSKIVFQEYGGTEGFSEIYVFKKDSITCKQLSIPADASKNSLKKYPNSDMNWNHMLEALDLKSFENLNNTKYSNIEYDGVDMNIIVHLYGGRTISVINGIGNQSWEKILDEFHVQKLNIK